MEKWKGKYRIPSARAAWWDYTNDAAYFITICTYNQEHFFGTCKDGRMKLSPMGVIVQGIWYGIPNHFSHVYLGEFIVMPNHIHGVLILDRESPRLIEGGIPSKRFQEPKNNSIHPKEASKKRISPKSGSLSVIVGSFKSACTKYINIIEPDNSFGWQERLWDVIIRDADSFTTISKYIMNNPKKWKDDRFYSDDEDIKS